MHIYIIMHSLYKAVSQNVWLWSILKCKTKLGNLFYIKIIGQESICLYGFLCVEHLNRSNYSKCHRHKEMNKSISK